MPKFEAVRFDPRNKDHQVCLRYIFMQIRPEDQYEIAAVGLSLDDARVGVLSLALSGHEVWLLTWNQWPVFVWGVNPHHKGTYGLFGFGTKDTRRAMPSITRWGMGTWLPDFLARTEARRIEVRVPVSSVHSINWLMSLGLQPECTLANYSVVGEPFLQLAFSSKAFENVQPTMVRDHRAETSPGHRSSL